MKKSLLAMLIGASVFSTAQANWYVQGDLGYSKVKFSAYSNVGGSKAEPRLTVGYRMGDFRLALDYSNYGKFSGTGVAEDYRGATVTEHVSSKIQGFGLSAIYDIDINSEVKPYVGVRLASNIFNIKNTGPAYLETDKVAKFGYGVMAGVSYGLTSALSLNAGLEYNSLGKFEDTKVTQYGAKVGLRFEF